MIPVSDGESRGLTALATLCRFARPRAVRERCELCDAGLASHHSHLIEPATRRLLCACDACAMLFGGQAQARYRRVPRRVRYLNDFRMGDSTWEDFSIPIDLAFFVHSTPVGRVIALYPGPAGITEASVSDEAWQTLLADNPVLHDLEPDVEALLVNRVGTSRDYYRIGVDECYRLTGLIRTNWRGFSGGPAVWTAIGGFFAELKERIS
jgi:hypothetical protein